MLFCLDLTHGSQCIISLMIYFLSLQNLQNWCCAINLGPGCFISSLYVLHGKVSSTFYTFITYVDEVSLGFPHNPLQASLQHEALKSVICVALDLVNYCPQLWTLIPLFNKGTVPIILWGWNVERIRKRGLHWRSFSEATSTKLLKLLITHTSYGWTNVMCSIL